MIEEPRTDEEMETLLEGLFLNNRDLARIEAYLDRFNPLSVMRVSRTEIRHSNILAWLLAPDESHGLGDRFLRAFLAEACRGRRSPKALDILRADLRDVMIRREWRHIDILALSPSNQWAVAVENKVKSRQSPDQLKRYREAIESAYGSNEVVGVLLTVDHEDPEDEEYVRLGYDWILSTLDNMTRTISHLSKETSLFINHYLETIRELTGLNAEKDQMAVLARRLYVEHRRALDFIFEQVQSELKTAADGVFEDGRYGRICRRNKGMIGFIPRQWERILRREDLSWDGCNSWFGGLPLACFFQLSRRDDRPDGSLALVAEVGPLEDNSIRIDLIETVEKAVCDRTRVEFGSNARKENKKYSRFLKRARVHIDNSFDPIEMKEKMEKLLNDWQGVFEQVAGGLPSFVERAKQTQRGSGA